MLFGVIRYYSVVWSYQILPCCLELSDIILLFGVIRYYPVVWSYQILPLFGVITISHYKSTLKSLLDLQIFLEITCPLKELGILAVLAWSVDRTKELSIQSVSDLSAQLL